MSLAAATILGHLKTVDDERQRRDALPALQARVVALKAYQQRRFAHTYADLLASARYGGAARYFLDELYGPKDFTRRDRQFARVAPALVRVFPNELAETIATLTELHALSETLDTATGLALANERIGAVDYVRAWQGVGRAPDRERQIVLTLAVATELDRLMRLTLLRNSLRMMRGPARVAGLSELQRTLETGFDTFRAMKGAQEFIALVGARERGLAATLFAARAGDAGAGPSTSAVAGLPSP